MELEKLSTVIGGELVQVGSCKEVNSATVYPQKADADDVCFVQTQEDADTAIQNGVRALVYSDLLISVSDEDITMIKVEDVNGQVNKLKIYKKLAANEFDEFGEKAKYDYNRAYALFNENNEILIIQYYICDPILKEIDYFR